MASQILPRSYQQQQQQAPQNQQQPVSRFSNLPEISDNSRSQQQQQQLVPLLDAAQRPQSSDGVVSVNQGAAAGLSEEQVRQLDTRLTGQERANRALLDEVMRLQAELRSVSRRGEDALREERQARQFLETSLRTSADAVNQLAQRLRAQEEKLREERQQLSELSTHARTIEQQMSGAQHELDNRRETQLSRIATLEQELETVSRSKAQLERIAFQLVDEMRSMKQKLESQGLDFSSVASEIKVKSRRLEDEYNVKLENVQRRLEKAGDLDQQTQQLRSTLDGRLSELRDVVSDLRTRSEKEADERRSLEQQLNSKLSQLNAGLSEQARRREEAFHNLDVRQRERERQSENERVALLSRIQESVEELNQRIAEKEMRLREEAGKRQAESEKLILKEQEARLAFEKEARHEQERRWENLRHQHEEELAGVRSSLKTDRSKTVESIRKIDESITIIEKQLEEARKDTGKVLSAEISSRKAKERETRARLQELEEKISAATASLQQAIGGVSAQMRASSDANKKHTQEMLTEHKREVARQMADIDAQIASLKARIAGVDDKVEAKISAATTAMAQNLREKVDSISLWQTQTNAQLTEIKNSCHAAEQGVSRNTEKLNLLKDDLRTSIGNEVNGRVQDVDNLRREVEQMKERLPKEDAVTRKELEECQASVRRLAEIAQTVKTVLGMKIQSEQKLRVEEIKSVQSDVSQLRSLVEPLIARLMEPKVFVKPDNWQSDGKDQAEKEADDINKWSIYSAFRWMSVKEKWMYLKWQASSRGQEQQQQQQ